MNENPHSYFVALTGTYGFHNAANQFARSLVGMTFAPEPLGTPRIAVNYGRLVTEGDEVLHLFTPVGQRHFEIMIPRLPGHLLGFVILLRSHLPELFREARSIINTLGTDHIPYVVAALHSDHPDAWTFDEIRLALCLNTQVALIPCVPNQAESARNVLLELVETIDRFPTGYRQ